VAVAEAEEVATVVAAVDATKALWACLRRRGEMRRRIDDNRLKTRLTEGTTLVEFPFAFAFRVCLGCLSSLILPYTRTVVVASSISYVGFFLLSNMARAGWVEFPIVSDIRQQMDFNYRPSIISEHTCDAALSVMPMLLHKLCGRCSTSGEYPFCLADTRSFCCWMVVLFCMAASVENSCYVQLYGWNVTSSRT